MSKVQVLFDPREVHHFGLLFGYGADCVNPYLAYEVVKKLAKEKDPLLSINIALNNYRTAVNQGILKIISKMGIATLQSYRGAQIFEALGLNSEIIKICFKGTASRIGGSTFEIIEQETFLRHKQAFSENIQESQLLPSGGIYQWKKDGEFHLWNPESISALQDATRSGDYELYLKFSELINDQSENPTTLRSLFKFKERPVIPLKDVESESEILKRFATGAMSFGSVSGVAHRTLAIALNRLGGKSNTGEGGEDPERFKPFSNGDSARSAIKQIASGRFGVTAEYLVNADEIQIKIAQGAKPGEGGQLPGYKVNKAIAKIRYTTSGVTLISPPPHHDIYSIEDLSQLIFDLKNINPKARISVKLVSAAGVGTVAVGVTKGHADMVLISGGDGGTGASPLSSIRSAGIPWELGLAETHQALLLNNLRSRVKLQVDGQMRTGRDVIIAALLGAEEFGFCTAALIVMGCVMLRHCHLNNCSLGVATQNKDLEKRFAGKVEYVENYFRFIARDVRELMAKLGISRFEELVGRTDFLKVNKKILPWKAKLLDLRGILYQPLSSKDGKDNYQKNGLNLEKVLDQKLITLSYPAFARERKVKENLNIKNTDRSAGTMLSGEVCRRFGHQGLPEDRIHFKFQGVAGQSFAAWLAKGITFELEGLSNDYVGKGLSGGKIIIYPDRSGSYDPEKNIIIGNTTFYGAISGQAYICGLAGERFCIRNSGLLAVVEGVGDHACEYMTGGRVVVLGATGRNFAAGMSGGIAYVLDLTGKFKSRCNRDMVTFDKITDSDSRVIRNLINNHYKCTRSVLGKKIIGDFKKYLDKFIKVIPYEYKRILMAKKGERKNTGINASIKK